MIETLSLRSRQDPRRRQIGYARWMVLLFGLGTPVWIALLIGGTWSILSGSQANPIASAISLVVIWVIFLSLLIVPEAWYLIRMWRGIPALQVDAWGLVWGRDWSRDLSIEWHEIAGIATRRMDSEFYSDRLLVIHPKHEAIPGTKSAATRFMAWVSRKLYGSSYVLSPKSLRIDRRELVGLIREHFDGPMDPAVNDA